MSAFAILFAAFFAGLADDGGYRWVPSETDSGRVYLYRNGVQVGGYDLEEHFYRPYDGRVWGPRCEPPLPPPCFGVAAEKLGSAPTYRLDGRAISAEAAYAAVEKGLPDDAKKLRVTIVGPEPLRRRARSEIEGHAGFADLRDDVVVRDYPPDHWAMRAGFVATGQPTIYCQAPDGTVLHRQDDYRGGADAAVAALRRARDAYDPRRDPDRRCFWPQVARYASLGAAGLAGVGVILAVRRGARF